jgi:hypothetical protein
MLMSLLSGAIRKVIAMNLPIRRLFSVLSELGEAQEPGLR